MKYNEILLFSGGIDSYVAWHFLDAPKTLYFNCHTRCSEQEIRVIKELIPTTIIEDVINFSTREDGAKAYVPFRNLHFALLANHWADKIIIAGLRDDLVSDKNAQVFGEWSGMMSRMEGRDIQVMSPFWTKTKAEVVAWYLRNKGGRDTLLKTISCYNPTELSNYCGECPSCFRKWNALWVNGIRGGFYNTSLMDDYYTRALQGFYIPERNDSIIVAVEEWRRNLVSGKRKVRSLDSNV